MFPHKAAPPIQLLVTHQLDGDLVLSPCSTTKLINKNQLEHTQREPRFWEGICLEKYQSVTYNISIWLWVIHPEVVLRGKIFWLLYPMDNWILNVIFALVPPRSSLIMDSQQSKRLALEWLLQRRNYSALKEKQTKVTFSKTHEFKRSMEYLW